jgi:hypothetical protein
VTAKPCIRICFGAKCLIKIRFRIDTSVDSKHCFPGYPIYFVTNFKPTISGCHLCGPLLERGKPPISSLSQQSQVSVACCSTVYSYRYSSSIGFDLVLACWWKVLGKPYEIGLNAQNIALKKVCFSLGSGDQAKNFRIRIRRSRVFLHDQFLWLK